MAVERNLIERIYNWGRKKKRWNDIFISFICRKIVLTIESYFNNCRFIIIIFFISISTFFFFCILNFPKQWPIFASKVIKSLKGHSTHLKISKIQLELFFFCLDLHNSLFFFSKFQQLLNLNINIIVYIFSHDDNQGW